MPKIDGVGELYFIIRLPHRMKFVSIVQDNVISQGRLKYSSNDEFSSILKENAQYKNHEKEEGKRKLVLNDFFIKKAKELLHEGIWDGDIAITEAIVHYKDGKGEPVQQDASKLVVDVNEPFNADGWAKGVVQGFNNEFLVHGKVDLFNLNGEIVIDSQAFDFGRENGAALREFGTTIGRDLVGSGTEFEIHYYGSPSVIFDGSGYMQRGKFDF